MKIIERHHAANNYIKDLQIGIVFARVPPRQPNGYFLKLHRTVLNLMTYEIEDFGEQAQYSHAYPEAELVIR